MNTKQIIDEMEKEFDEKFTCGGITGTVAFRKGKDRPYEIKKFIHSYTRKLIEAVAEEIIGKTEKEERILKEGVDYDVHKVLDFGMEIARVSGKNQLRAEQRLKVKEILSNLK